mmetsp:Transcript_125459/g.222326  ORF Transcript_125459/g.222326 Transcript_125459/m.222326 type:complete len:336 (+) Transcript_125459:82-1089(+)
MLLKVVLAVLAAGVACVKPGTFLGSSRGHFGTTQGPHEAEVGEVELGRSFHIVSGWSPDLKSQVWFYSHRSCSQDSSDSCNNLFQQEMRNVTEGARESGIEPSHTFTYSALTDDLMKNPKWKQHVEPQLRGRGFWFWKPALANHLLAQTDLGIKDGDIFIYVDGDTPDTIQRLVPLANNQSGSWDIVVERQDPHCEYNWTKGDIFEHFGVKPQDPHYGKTQQYHASRFAIRINEKSRKFLNLWEQLMQDFHLVSDEPSNYPNADGFRENRHDQSMYSMLLKASLEHNGACQLGETIRSESEELKDLPIKSGSLVEWKPHERFGISGLTVMPHETW